MALRISAAEGRRGGRRPWLGAILWLTIVAVTLGTGAKTAAGQTTPAEYQLKAVFLYRFAQFAEWPDGTFGSPDAPLVIGVLGDDPFGSYLEETVRGETVNGHPLEVRRYRRVEEITTCHILFVNRPEPNRLAALNRLRKHPILTVGDAERFANDGGMIQFVTEHDRIQLHINLEAVEAAQVKLSSKLLRPATIVATRKE